MGLEKAGLTFGKELVAWARTGKSLFAMKPVKVNTAGLKLAPKLESDTLCIASKINKKAGTILNTKTNQIEPIVIDDFIPRYSRHYDGLEALNTKGDTIGRVSFTPSEEAGGLFPMDKPSLFIDYLGTQSGYKGIGTELVRKVVQISKEAGFGGRVRLQPCTGSVPSEFRFPGFYDKCQTSSAALQYKKMGFKAYDQEIDKLLEQELASGGNGLIMKNGKVVRDKYTAPMYLPENVIEKYLNMKFI